MATNAPGALPIRVTMPALYAKQRRAIFDPARIVCIEASTKAGKTVGCLVWQGARVLSDRHAREHWWVAPVYPQAQIAFRRVLKMFPRSQYEKNETALTVTFRNGARWVFKSAEKPDNLYGEDVADAVIDEASRCREEAWHAVRSTLTATRGPVRMIGNVKGRKNFFYHLCRKAQAGEREMAYHKLTAYDAVAGGVLAAEEIDAAERQLPAHVFRELYLAEPSDDGGNPFGLDAIRACYDPALAASAAERPTTAFGVDLAKSVDYTWIVGLDAEGRQTASERFQKPWGETEAEVLRLVGSVPASVDSTGVGDPIVEAMQRKARSVEGFKFSSTSKQQIMEGLAAAIQQRRIRIWDARLVAELEAFEYVHTRTGVRYSAPEGLHDDGVCALALALHRHARPRLSAADLPQVPQPW